MYTYLKRKEKWYFLDGNESRFSLQISISRWWKRNFSRLFLIYIFDETMKGKIIYRTMIPGKWKCRAWALVRANYGDFIHLHGFVMPRLVDDGITRIHCHSPSPPLLLERIISTGRSGIFRCATLLIKGEPWIGRRDPSSPLTKRLPFELEFFVRSIESVSYIRVYRLYFFIRCFIYFAISFDSVSIN